MEAQCRYSCRQYQHLLFGEVKLKPYCLCVAFYNPSSLLAPPHFLNPLPFVVLTLRTSSFSTLSPYLHRIIESHGFKCYL